MHANGTLPRVLGPGRGVLRGRRLGDRLGDLPRPGRASRSDVPFLGPIILVWIIGGLFSAAGALTLAELGAMLPQAGGPYVYLRAAYGPLPAFLFGWTEFLVVRTGSMATLAAAFARYFVAARPRPRRASAPRSGRRRAAVSAIAIVTAVNVLGTTLGRHGSRSSGTVAQGRRRRWP